MLFIVSQVGPRGDGDGDGSGLEMDVARAEGDKCARCWRIVDADFVEPPAPKGCATAA